MFRPDRIKVKVHPSNFCVQFAIDILVYTEMLASIIDDDDDGDDDFW